MCEDECVDRAWFFRKGEEAKRGLDGSKTEKGGQSARVRLGFRINHDGQLLLVPLSQQHTSSSSKQEAIASQAVHKKGGDL